ncbi:MAG: cytochrome P450 [Acidobacteriota bacterium]|nr:cytochrome P450 [Acidobacteriota bacterium]
MPLPPGPVTRPSWRNLLRLRREPLAFLPALAHQYGDVSAFMVGPVPIVLLNHPDYVRDLLVTHEWNFVKGPGLERTKRLLGEGLLTSEGELHRRQRRLAQPAFHRQQVETFASTMVDYAVRTRERWADGQTVDVLHEMMRLTLAIVGKTLFDAEVEAEAGEIGAALTEAVESFVTFASPITLVLDRLPTPRSRRFARARARLDDTIFRMIDRRRALGSARDDLLSRLLQAQDADGGGMSDELLRDEAMTLFIAGHETTANALTWTWHLLSQAPAEEARLHEELDRVLGGRLPALADVAALSYTEMIFTEAMRLYPPAWIMGRRVVTEHHVGGFRLPRNAVAVASQWVMHRDPRFYPDPEVFRPERWTPEARAARPRFAYFPFGGGSRLCIGEPFAWLEGVLVLATIAQQWRLRGVPGHRVVPQPKITLRPKGGLPMTLARR